MFIKSWLAPPSLLQSSTSSTTLPMILPTAPTSPSFSPHTKPLSVPHHLNVKHLNQISKRSNVPIPSDCSYRQNNNNNNNNNKFNRANIASFHDWSEKSLENAPVSKIYQEMATLSSICSLSESNRNELSRENNGRRQVVCHKLFLPEGTDLTKGEKNIIAGLCRNRLCTLTY
ncbi:signal transducer and activator of transcription B-like [Octopus bimaculoides]|uniref:signal transducer and activator of transcription B-like n=1 Tax=Octopus bimaculoides TaxID=37653 RepID=UPI00071C5BB9|nr:signal transducer and activator of transcription B-like [Octopus bimaculoides]|eukprot:XP_014787420.1 PREDICTED: signal transducer and activator of transcription B-like [Octopus bimaculoides]